MIYVIFNIMLSLFLISVSCYSYAEKDVKGDKNPKDFIIFDANDFSVRWTTKDNTGEKKYIEGMVFPTLTFPSDHGITATSLASGPSPVVNLLRAGASEGS